MLEGNKVIITVAINGGMQQDRDGAIVPKQPDEIGEEAARCWEAGAAMVHVHARDKAGKNSGDPEIYAQIIREIRARSPILVQTTNGIGVRRDPRPASSTGRTTRSGLVSSPSSRSKTFSVSLPDRRTFTIPRAATPAKRPM